MADTNKMNLFQKMAYITNELGTVAKNLTISTGKGAGYKAVSERDVIDVVKPIEAKYGVYSYPKHREIVNNEIMTNTRTYNGVSQESKQMYMRLKTIYRFVNVDNPEEAIEMVSYGDGLDSGDKATGKAMTYADKYALMKAYKISTGDDNEQSEQLPAKEKPAEPTQADIEKAREQMFTKVVVDTSALSQPEKDFCCKRYQLKGIEEITPAMYEDYMNFKKVEMEKRANGKN